MLRRIAYFAIGVLVSLSAGLSNGLLLGNLPQIQGALGLTSVEAAWLSAAYSMSNVCTSFLLIKFRQQFGLQRIARPFLLGFVLLSGAQVLVHSYGVELALRLAAGVIGSGFTPLGFFYIMQALPVKARLGGMIIGVGLTQVALPLARAISPSLLLHGEIQNLYLFEFGLSIACLGSMALLRLPPSNTARVLEKLDFVTVAILAPGVMLLVSSNSMPSARSSPPRFRAFRSKRTNSTPQLRSSRRRAEAGRRFVLNHELTRRQHERGRRC